MEDALDSELVVAALGGNALLKRGEPLTHERHKSNASEAAKALARLLQEEGCKLCVTHGNGPQVGLLAQQDPEAPLDVLGAESQGQIGYVLALELGNELRSPPQVAALLTRTLVDSKDPAFQHPTKPIGPSLPKENADRLAEKGFTIAQDCDKWRRVVASPAPLRILELEPIKALLRLGVITVCTGGGGIPVAEDPNCPGHLQGVEAVIDKDAASALLAISLRASVLLLLTDASAIHDPRRWPAEKAPLPSPISPDQLEIFQFPEGSMGPKVSAACKFVRATGGRAGIGELRDALDILRGIKGTTVQL